MELLIVIVVIAILATISIVAFNGVQARARDAQRQTDLSNVAKAMKMYKIDKGGYPNTSTGCASGSGGGGNGWLGNKYGYTYSVGECLVANKYLSSNIVDPSGLTSCSGADCHAYMVYDCGTSAWLMANLETEPQNSTATDGKCASSWDTAYGINYLVQLH